ncbi:MAG: FAD-dependent oxidoreductase [Deltaproteobacteria bacterium]|jgi:glycine/D-amino acid oxidase-like deaminating enzyme|nr:FAD-dependent oxidoreductase [Deltaproteobacteria bacterium]
MSALRASRSPLSREADVKMVDVLVCGGGPAGVAAAATCGRAGLSTLLVEKNGFCGGGAVAGLSGTICGLYTADENAPQRLVQGFAEEFCVRLRRRGGLTEAQRYGKTLVHTHDPLVWREVADDLLEESGAGRLYHTMVADVRKNGARIEGVNVFSSAGPAHISCKLVVDATGDGVVAALAGCSFRCGNDGGVQYPTMMFRLCNVQIGQFLEYYGDDAICPEKMTDAIRKMNAAGAYVLPRDKVWIFPTPHPGVLLVNATRAGDGGAALNPLHPEDRTAAEVSGRRAVREFARFMKEHVPGCGQSFVIDTGTEVGVRQTRSIDTCVVLSSDDVARCVKRKDGILKCAWPVELHSGDKPKLHWLLDDYYELSYFSLVPKDMDNLLVAGRCIGAEHEALASVRVTAQCFEMGHAAGLAAALALKEATPFRSIDVEELRNRLGKDGSNI